MQRGDRFDRHPIRELQHELSPEIQFQLLTYTNEPGRLDVQPEHFLLPGAYAGWEWVRSAASALELAGQAAGGMTIFTFGITDVPDNS